MTKINAQLLTAVALTAAGIVLLYLGFYAAPKGEIDNSVLVSFGEIATFAGALFGVDYRYKLKKKNDKNGNNTSSD